MPLNASCGSRSSRCVTNFRSGSGAGCGLPAFGGNCSRSASLGASGFDGRYCSVNGLSAVPSCVLPVEAVFLDLLDAPLAVLAGFFNVEDDDALAVAVFFGVFEGFEDIVL